MQVRVNDDGAMRSDSLFRVLALDGGGVRGVFAASVLSALEEEFGNDFCQRFDLITGTSTGGLIALGIAHGRTAKEVLQFYRDSIPGIFPSGRIAKAIRGLRGVLFSKYSGEPLEEECKKFFGECTKLSDLKKSIVIPTFETRTGKVVCFKTQHHEDLRTDKQRAVWEVAMATAAAPTYFPPYTSSWNAQYLDGGLWANSPSLVGLTEAVRYFHIPLERIRVVSIGTLSESVQLSRVAFGGKLPWMLRHNLASIAMEAQKQAALNQAGLLLGGVDSGRLLRIDYEMGKACIKLDDAKCFGELSGHGAEAAKQHIRDLNRLIYSKS